MTLTELITDLNAAGANENTIRLAMNCYELGRVNERERLATELLKGPVNDTAHSIAVWIREQV